MAWVRSEVAFLVCVAISNKLIPGLILLSVQAEFESGAEGELLEGEAWNDSVIKELQERIHSSGASGSGQNEQEATTDGQQENGDGQHGKKLHALQEAMFLL